jgi:hypothetical protein
MIRNAVRAAAILCATLALPATILGVPLPASAANNNHLCETYSLTKNCVGSSSLNLYAGIGEANPGRNLVETPLGGSFDQDPTYLLQFSADPTKCVADGNDNYLDIRPCNGGTGIIWARDTVSTGVYRWINLFATNNDELGQTDYMTGFALGGAMLVDPPKANTYQRFSWQ